MIQIFFISPNGFQPVVDALAGVPGHRSVHAWQDTDAGATQSIGAVELLSGSDGEQVASALEAAGILILPDHRFNGPVNKPVVDALSAYGVNASDTTGTAMEKVRGKSGFPPHKPKRFT